MNSNTIKDQNAGIFFDKFAADFDTLYDYQRGSLMRWVDNKFRSDISIRFILTFEELGDLKGKTVLDIGCGSGPYLKHALLKEAQFVTGLDAAQNMLNISNERINLPAFQNRFKLHHGLFPDSSISKHDFVIVMGVMDYVDNKIAFINELFLKTSEKAVVSFPSKHWFRTPIRMLRYKLRKCPLWFYNESEIKNLAINAGFKNVLIKKISGAGMDYVATFYK